MSLTQDRLRKAQRYEANKLAQAYELAARFDARIYPHGRAWRVVGPTISMTVSDLALLREADFMPD